MQLDRYLNDKRLRQSKGMDRLASVYGGLKRLFLGRRLDIAESHFLSLLSSARNLLIVGGGQGQLLEQIFKINPSLHIFYVESSQKMMAVAARRFKRQSMDCSTIQFINAFAEDVQLEHRVDAVITSFVLDFYTDDDVEVLIRRIMGNVDTADALWLQTDFKDNKTLWGRWLIRAMYLFFNLFCKLGVTQLPDYDRCFDHAGWDKLRTKSFSRGLVTSSVYQLIKQ